MQALGIHAEGESMKIALVTKVKNKIHVEFTRLIERSQFSLLYQELKQEKTLLVTGLEPTAMIRRETSLKLKNERAILKALPFQIETVIPYPAHELILVPCFYLNEQILFATTQTLLKAHLREYQTLGIDSDIVSATGIALARWGAWKYPETKNQCLMQNGCCVLTSEWKIALLQAYDQVERMKTFALNKYPSANIVLVDDPYAIPIGLGLDALMDNGLQLRVDPFITSKMRTLKNKWRTPYAVIASLLALGLGFAGFYQTNSLKKQLTNKLDGILGPSSLSLSDRVIGWAGSLSSEKKSFPLLPNTPSVADLLGWMASQKQEIEVINLHYRLVNYPKIGETLESYQAKVELEFKASTPTLAREFHESLLKDDSFVNTSQEVTWNASKNLYNASFYLRSK